MIRQAHSEDFSTLTPDTETAVRIHGLANAYGTEQSFLHFWSILEEEKCVGFLSLLDGTVQLVNKTKRPFIDWTLKEINEFLLMQPDIQKVHTTVEIGKHIFEYGNWKMITGTVMKSDTVSEMPSNNICMLTPREVYPILSNCFKNDLPPFSPWYVDVSHRIRHGFCRIKGIWESGKPVACVMTTAECDGAAIIGAVATLPESRGRGYASGLVSSLTSELHLEGRSVYLLPKNEAAHKLYSAIGFYDCGKWADLIPLNKYKEV